jgi:type II secretory pathway pseudopilin PulG
MIAVKYVTHPRDTIRTMKVSRGFTVIELTIVAVLFGLASVLFFVQKATIESAGRDEHRKTAINSMYYGLEEVYFKENKTYPRTISAETLRSVDPELFKDPDGVAIGDGESNYRYETASCNGDTCKEYTLRTTLENEADYVKTQREAN